MSVLAVDGGDRSSLTVAPLHTMVRRHPISQSTKRLKALQVGADTLGILAAFGTAYVFRNGRQDTFDADFRQLAFCAACLPVWLVVFGYHRLYSARVIDSRWEECSRLLHSIVASAALMALFSYLIRQEVSRSLLVGGGALAFVLCMVEREGMRAFFRSLRTSGRLQRRALIIGSNEEAQSIARMFRSTPHLGYQAVGLCGEQPADETCVPWLGSIYQAADVAVEAQADTAVVATTSLSLVETNWLVRRLHDAGVHIELSAGLRDIPAERLSVRDLGRHAVFYLEPTVHSGWRSVAKRAFDLGVSVPMLILSAPLLVVSALAIKLTSRGPVLFHQERVGQGGEPFQMHKLRTMVDGAHEMVLDLVERNECDGPLFKLREDPRVTRVGRVLRTLSIDELPQLWNVVRGEMSLVGPRPALRHEMSGWTPELHNRLRVKPGLTGMWQVSGRSNASFDDYVRLDLFYVDNWSLMRDLAIFAKTIPTVLLRRGAC